MKQLHKLFPPQMAQLVFIDSDGEVQKFNGSDFDVFLWLIYNTHKYYFDEEGSNSAEFEYKDVKQTLKDMDTASIKKSLQKINETQILSNYLQSYGDKKVHLLKPFEIEIITTDKGISYGFSVTTSKSFLKSFDNPKSNVDVNYKTIYALNKMSKYLYLFLRDAYGGYENTERKRIVPIDELRYMMNIQNKKTTNSNFITELKKASKDINKYSDLTIKKIKPKMKKNLRSGISEIVSVEFVMMKDSDKIYTTKPKTTKSKKDTKSTDTKVDDKKVETSNEEVTDTVAVKDEFEVFVDNLIENIYQQHIADGKPILKTVEAFKNGVRKKLLSNPNVEAQFELVSYLDEVKTELKDKITDNQPHMLVFKDEQNPYNSYYFDNEYQLLNSVTNEAATTTISDTMNFIDDNFDELQFDIQRCGWGDEFKVGRIE